MNKLVLYMYVHMIPVDISLNEKTVSCSFLLLCIFEAILLPYSIYLKIDRKSKG